jgi:diguanylate cyclase (GGDEF)-like protein
MGEIIAKAAVNVVGAERAKRYDKTRLVDEEYTATLRTLQAISDDALIDALYIQTYTEEGCYFIFETDEACLLGDFDPFDPSYPEFKRQVLNGEDIEPIISSTVWGWRLSIYEPIKDEYGTVVAYVGADYDMQDLVNARIAYALISLGITLLFVSAAVAFSIYLVNREIIVPVKQLTNAVEGFVVKQESSVALPSETSALNLNITTGNEFQRLSDGIKSMEKKIYAHLLSLNEATVKAETDSLTSLWNRETFQNNVEFCLQKKPNPDSLDAFFMLDVDYFKNVNDTYGHIAGDVVLIKCAAALKGILRGSDFAARQGGDEFVIFLKGIGSIAVAEQKAEQIKRAFNDIVPDGGEEHVTASIGIAIAPAAGKTYEELYNRADAALYRAKETGRDRYFIAS